MNDKQINKWLRSRFTQVGWILLGYYGLLNVLALLGMGLEALEQALWAFAVGGNVGSMDFEAIAENAWGYVMTVLVALAVLDAWKGRDYWKEEILVPGSRRMDMRTALCLICLCMGTQMVNSIWVTNLELILNIFGKSLLEMLESVSGASGSFSMFLYASLLAPIVEEVVFRGYVLRTLRPYGKRFAIWGSAVLFGLFHGNLMQTPYAILMGLILGYVTVEYSILWAIGLHMFNNLVLADLLGRLTANLPDVLLSAINLGIFGPALVGSVVILARNSRQVRAYRRSEYLDKRVLKCFFLNSGVLIFTVLALVNMISLLFV